MNEQTRREFLKTGFNAVVAYALFDTLFSRDAFTREIKPVTHKWARELNDLCLDLRQRSITLVQWQEQVEKFLQQVDLKDLLPLIDFDQLTKNFEFPDLGVNTKNVRFPKLEGLPQQYAFFSKIFGVKQGRAIIPHGHKNMVSAHLVLKGEFELRHYDKVRDEANHMIITPTIDTIAKAGDASSISDDKNNIHWFITRSDYAFTFDVIMTNIDPAFGKPYDIENIDPAEAEKISGNLLRVKKLDVDEALRKYGKEMHH